MFLLHTCFQAYLFSGKPRHTCFQDIYFLEIAKLMYKIHNNVLSFANSDKFNLIKNCYTNKTRLSHKNNFFLPRTRTRLGQKSLSFAGIKIWNEIPSSLKEVSFYRFKKAVKAHFLSNYETDKSKNNSFLSAMQ